MPLVWYKCQFKCYFVVDVPHLRAPKNGSHNMKCVIVGQNASSEYQNVLGQICVPVLITSTCVYFLQIKSSSSPRNSVICSHWQWTIPGSGQRWPLHSYSEYNEIGIRIRRVPYTVFCGLSNEHNDGVWWESVQIIDEILFGCVSEYETGRCLPILTNGHLKPIDLLLVIERLTFFSYRYSHVV